MDDLQEVFKNNAVVVVLLVFALMFGIWILVEVGLPFLEGSPKTFKAQNVTTISETEDKVFVRLNDPSKRSRTKVLADGNPVEWGVNNTVVLNKSNVSSIEVQSIVQGEEYSSYNHTVGAKPLNISTPSGPLFIGNEYTFTVTAKGAQPNEITDVQWFVNGQPKDLSGKSLSLELEDRNYTIEVTAVVDGVKKTVTEDIKPVEPNDVILNAQASSTNVTTFKEITFNVTEKSNQSVEFVNWNFDDGTEEKARINNSVLHWYTQPGTYKVTVTGSAQAVEESGSDNITINVREPEEERTIYTLTVQVFERGGPSLDNATVSLSNLKVKETDTNGTVKFNVTPGEYSLKIEKGGYRSNTTLVDVQEDKIVQTELVRDIGSNNTTVSDDDTNTTNESVDSVDLVGNNSTVTQNNVTVNASNVTAPTALEKILNGTKGNGTRASPHIITTVAELQAIQADPDAHYALGNNIDASNTIAWNEVSAIRNNTIGTADQKVFETTYAPIVEGSQDVYVNGTELNRTAYQINYFNGELVFNTTPANLTNASENASVKISYKPDNVYRGFDPIELNGGDITIEGRGYAIRNLYINRPTQDEVGLVGHADNAVFRDLTFTSALVEGSSTVGILAARLEETRVRNVVVSGSVIGERKVGGITGESFSTQYDEVISRATVQGTAQVGGITGRAVETPGAGDQGNTIIEESYVRTPSSGQISGERNVGGMIGIGRSVLVNNSYTNVTVNGGNNTGGIVGYLQGGSTVKNGYSASDISSTSSSAGSVVGRNDGSTVTAFYWDTDKAGSVKGIGIGTGSESVTGLSTSKMQGSNAKNSMSKLNFTDIWSTTDSYPEINRTGDSVYRVEVNVTGSDGVNIQSATVELGSDRQKSGGSVVFEEVPRGQYNLTVDSDGYVKNTTSVFIDGDAVIEKQLKVAEQYDLILSAVDLNNSGISNSEFVFNGQTYDGSTKVINNVDQGKYQVSVTAPEHIPVNTTLYVNNSTADSKGDVEESFTLYEERFLDIEVIDNTSREPVETVVNGSLNGANYSTSFEENRPIELTGVYELSSQSNYTLTVEARGYESNSIKLNDSELNTTVTVGLNRSENESVLSVVARDKFDGNAVNNTEVLVVNEANDNSTTKTINTSKDNFVHFVLNESSSYSVFVSKEGYVGNSTTVQISDNTELSLDMTKEKTVNLRTALENNTSVTIENSTITLKSSETGYSQTIPAGSDGQATFAEVPENRSYTIEVNARGYTGTTESIDLVAYDDEEVRNVTMPDEPEIIINLSEKDTDEDGRLEFKIAKSDVDASNVSGVTASDVISGQTNPEITLYKGVRYNFTNVDDTDSLRFENDSGSVLLETGGGTPRGTLVDDLDVGFVVDEGRYGAFTVTGNFSNPGKYNYLADDGTVEGDLEGNLVYSSSKP